MLKGQLDRCGPEQLSVTVCLPTAFASSFSPRFLDVVVTVAVCFGLGDLFKHLQQNTTFLGSEPSIAGENQEISFDVLRWRPPHGNTARRKCQ